MGHSIPRQFRFGRKVQLPHDFVGIVNLTRVWQTGQHEKANTQLPPSLFSLCNYQLRRVALPSILPQLSCSRRTLS